MLKEPDSEPSTSGGGALGATKIDPRDQPRAEAAPAPPYTSPRDPFRRFADMWKLFPSGREDSRRRKIRVCDFS
uniref:Uncharacterized protein n=1 Tax=Callorhinchus milii TaxID=7868 RepID=A0A4W3H4D7_CALMI